MHLRAKVPADFTAADAAAIDRIPKTVLYSMVKHLAALVSESYDSSIESGAYLQRMTEEWAALHSCGIVAQRPVKLVAVQS